MGDAEKIILSSANCKYYSSHKQQRCRHPVARSESCKKVLLSLHSIGDDGEKIPFESERKCGSVIHGDGGEKVRIMYVIHLSTKQQHRKHFEARSHYDIIDVSGDL